MRKIKPPLEGFELVPDTSGKIVDSIWYNQEKGEIYIKFSWGDNLYFKQFNSEPESNSSAIKMM